MNKVLNPHIGHGSKEFLFLNGSIDWFIEKKKKQPNLEDLNGTLPLFVAFVTRLLGLSHV